MSTFSRSIWCVIVGLVGASSCAAQSIASPVAGSQERSASCAEVAGTAFTNQAIAAMHIPDPVLVGIAYEIVRNSWDGRQSSAMTMTGTDVVDSVTTDSSGYIVSYIKKSSRLCGLLITWTTDSKGNLLVSETCVDPCANNCQYCIIGNTSFCGCIGSNCLDEPM